MCTIHRIFSATAGVICPSTGFQLDCDCAPICFSLWGNVLEFAANVGTATMSHDILS